MEAALDTCFVVAWAEAAHYHRHWLVDAAADYGVDVRDLLEGALLYLATDYLQGSGCARSSAGPCARCSSRSTCWSPRPPRCPPRPIGRLETAIRGRTVSVLDVGARLTCVANLTGEPACSVPCGFTRAGLPIGLMIHGRAFEDTTVLRVAHAYEQANQWSARRPPEHRLT